MAHTRAIDEPDTTVTWRWLVAMIAVGLVAGLVHGEAMGVGLLGDDYLQQAMLSGAYPGQGYAPFDLYAFVRDSPQLHAQMLETGAMPWWSLVEGDPGADTEAVAFAVLRPLSSALLSLDRALAPIDRSWAVRAWHLHSLLWFVAAVAALGLALRRVFSPLIAGVAVVLFALDPAHVVPLAWVANRCALICACFGALALWAHLGWRGPSPSDSPPPARRSRRIAAEVAFASLALAGGEYGLVAAALVLGWELAGPRRDGLRAHALALLPSAIPALVYVAVHQGLGYGIYGGTYTDVFAASGEWLTQSGQRLAMLVTGVCWSVPGGTSSPGAGPAAFASQPGVLDLDRVLLQIAAVAFAAFALALALARAGLRDAEARALRGLTLGTFLGLIPLTAAPTQARLLVVSEIGASVLIAAMLVASARLLLGRRPEPAPDSAPTRPPPSRLRRLLPLPFALTLAYAHTISDVRVGAKILDDVSAMQRATLAAFTRGDLLATPSGLGDRDVFVLNSLSLFIGAHGPYLLDAHGWPRPRSWRALAMGPHALTATRLSADTLELQTIEGAWLTTPDELTFRPPDRPLRAGDVLERPGVRIEIVEAPGGRPTRVRARFDAPLEDPRYRFVTMTATGLQSWTPPRLYARAVVPRPLFPRLERDERVVLPPPRARS